ncbi:hypothetical protein Droror1_Dr00006445 [Drosera rotundifolia]
MFLCCYSMYWKSEDDAGAMGGLAGSDDRKHQSGRQGGSVLGKSQASSDDGGSLVVADAGDGVTSRDGGCD